MTESNGTEEQSGKKSKIIIIILIILLILSLLFGGILLGALLTGDDSFLTWLGITSGKQQWGGLKIDVNAGEYVAPVIGQTSQPGVAIPGWGTMTIRADVTTVDNVDFYNPTENSGLYYLTFELKIPSSDRKGYETLYQSDLIPPGLHIQTITLNRSLEKGTYDAVIHVQPYRMKDNSTTNNADMKTTLIVI